MSKNSKANQTTETATGVAVSEPAATAIVAARKFSIKKQVIVPTLSLAVNQPKILRIDSVIIESTYVDPDPKKAKEKPADVCHVTDMENNAKMLLLVPAVMKSALEREYMDNKKSKNSDGVTTITPVAGTERYIGCIFGVQKLMKRPGKRYHDIEIVELSEDGDAE